MLFPLARGATILFPLVKGATILLPLVKGMWRINAVDARGAPFGIRSGMSGDREPSLYSSTGISVTITLGRSATPRDLPLRLLPDGPRELPSMLPWSRDPAAEPGSMYADRVTWFVEGWVGFIGGLPSTLPLRKTRPSGESRSTEKDRKRTVSYTQNYNTIE